MKIPLKIFVQQNDIIHKKHRIQKYNKSYFIIKNCQADKQIIYTIDSDYSGELTL